MAKKNTKKESLETKIEKEIELMDNNNDKIDATLINASMETIIGSVNSVDVELKSNSEERIQEMVEQFSETLEPFKKLSEHVNNKTNTSSLDKKLNNASPDEIQSIIQKEIDDTKELIKKVEEMKNNINSNTKTSFASVTNWWNGMGYDF